MRNILTAWSVTFLQIYFKLVRVLGYEKGIAQFQLVYSLLLLLHLIQHSFLLVLDLVKRSDG